MTRCVTSRDSMSASSARFAVLGRPGDSLTASWTISRPRKLAGALVRNRRLSGCASKICRSPQLAHCRRYRYLSSRARHGGFRQIRTSHVNVNWWSKADIKRGHDRAKFTRQGLLISHGALPVNVAAVIVLCPGSAWRPPRVRQHDDGRKYPHAARAEAATLTADRGRRARGGPACGEAPRDAGSLKERSMKRFI